jgi:hypothetical protein
MRRSPRLQEKAEKIEALRGIEGAESVGVEVITAGIEGLRLTTEAVETVEVKVALSTKSSPSTEEEEKALYKKQGKSRAKVSLGGGTRVSADRGRTVIGPQGEHVSAYCLYEELAYISCEGLSREEAIVAIRENFGKISLGKKGLKELEELACSLSDEEMSSIISREDRKKLTRNLRGSNYLCEAKDELGDIAKTLPSDKQDIIVNGLERIEHIEYIDKIKEAIKLSNRAILSDVISGMLDICIWGSNKLEYVSFPEEGLGKNPNTGEEKKAKDGLRLLSDFLEDVSDVLCGKVEKTEEDSLFNKKTKQKLAKEWGITKERIGELLSGKIQLDDILDNEAFGNISNYMGKLFYYPRVAEDKLIDGSSEEWGSIIESKHYNKGALPRDNAVDKLYQVTARHVVLIFNCFRGLCKLSVRTQQAIVDSFLNDLIEKEGWKEKGVELESFRENLKQYALTDYEHKQFVMAGPESITTKLESKKR